MGVPQKRCLDTNLDGEKSDCDGVRGDDGNEVGDDERYKRASVEEE